MLRGWVGGGGGGEAGHVGLSAPMVFEGCAPPVIGILFVLNDLPLHFFLLSTDTLTRYPPTRGCYITQGGASCQDGRLVTGRQHRACQLGRPFFHIGFRPLPRLPLAGFGRGVLQGRSTRSPEPAAAV